MRSKTFRSLKVFEATKRTEIGKKTDESAGGTTNSIDPLSSKHNNKKPGQPHLLQNDKNNKYIYIYKELL